MTTLLPLTMTKPATAAVEWSSLPDTALQIISKHLAAYSADDYISFCSVCSSWCAAAAPRRLHFPFVVCSDENEGSNYSFLAFDGEGLSPSTELLPPAIPTGSICFGSSWGWLALFEPDSLLDYLFDPCSSWISLWKPFSGERVWLPPFSDPVASIPDKLILSSPDPTTDSGCMVVLTHHSPGFGLCIYYDDVVHNMSFCRVGDTEWTPIDKGTARDPINIAFFNGQAYFASYHRLIYVFILGPPARLEETSHKWFREWWSYPFRVQNYLIHSRDELFMITLEDDPSVIIIRLYLEDEKWMYSRGDLGDRAVFIGNNSSFAICADKFPNCKRNHIYKASDEDECIEVINAKDGSKHLINLPYKCLWSLATWLTPIMM